MSLPPWQLRGEGYIFLYRFPCAFVQAHIPPDWAGKPALGLGALMLISYRGSPVGPYDELLFIPALFRVGGRRYFSITQIFVSTQASVEAGRANWGIPKRRADFERERLTPQHERWRIQHEGRTVAEFHVQKFTRYPALPVTTRLIPATWRTLWQPLDGKQFLVTPSGVGRLRRASLLRASLDPTGWPDFTQGRLLFGVHAANFRLTFPHPRFITSVKAEHESRA